VLNALFTLLSTTVPNTSYFQYFGRRLEFWTKAATQPALFQRYIKERRMGVVAYGLPQETIIEVELWIYVKSGNVGQDPNDYPEQYITPLLDAVDGTLQSNTTADGRQTLGLDGYVTHCWIEGETTIAQGEESGDAQCIVIIPVSIRVDAQLGYNPGSTPAP
jgi:hypothetical protein